MRNVAIGIAVGTGIGLTVYFEATYTPAQPAPSKERELNRAAVCDYRSCIWDLCNGEQPRFTEYGTDLPSDGRADLVTDGQLAVRSDNIQFYDPTCQAVMRETNWERNPQAREFTPELQQAASDALNAQRAFNWRFAQEMYENDRAKRAQK